ncbi:MAG: MGMT family protein [Candidatus Saccharibacteria bacterium]|nr:MGMT family protein [Candidatus Saccharibacteria bacterium]
MVETSKQFAQRVYSIVTQIPVGRVMTYGQIAAICGSPKASRIVGGIAHYGPSDLPWHRVVNKKGGLASGYHGGRHAQKEHLEAEGVVVLGEEGSYSVDVSELLWNPEPTYREMLSAK